MDVLERWFDLKCQNIGDKPVNVGGKCVGERKLEQAVQM